MTLQPSRPTRPHSMLPAFRALFVFGALCLFTFTAMAAEPPRVVASIKPVHSLLAYLMDGVAEPGLLVGGNRSPHGYTLTAAQRRQLSDADLVVWVGPELEDFLSQPVAALPDKVRVIELLQSEHLKILPARHDLSRRDPYLWLDSRNALILLDELTEALLALDPERAVRYQENRMRAVSELSAVDRELEYRYRDVSASRIALYHDTQQYFEQAYALSPTATVTEVPGSAPSTAALLAARARMAEREVPCLFTEAGLPSPNLDLLTGGLTLSIVELDSLGTRLPPGPELYPRLMRENFGAIRNCVAKAAGQPTGHETFSGRDPIPGELSGRFMLVNHHGTAVTNLDYLGKYLLITFGYTSCPDVCPTTLALLSGALAQLGERANEIQPLFISVDPERDTQAVLSGYVSYFHPSIVGLTGPKSMIDRVVHDFGARYERVPSDDGDYAVNHTAGYYLFGPDGRYLEKIGHGLTVERLVEKLRAHLP